MGNANIGDQKEIKNLRLGELIMEMFITDSRCKQLERNLNPFVVDAYWREHPRPECKEGSIKRMKEDYEASLKRYKELLEEVDRREKLYLGKSP